MSFCGSCYLQAVLPLSFSLYAVLMWTMAHLQVAAHWTQWPAQAQASSCRPILFTANGGSRSSIVPTVTTTSRRSLCPGTPPLPVTCECMVSFIYLYSFVICSWIILIVFNVINSLFPADSLSLLDVLNTKS